MITFKRLQRSARWRLRRFITGKDEIGLFRLAKGGICYYPIISEIGRALFFGEFENNELDYVQRTLQDGDTFLDIGANAGIFTIVASDAVGRTGHVYAYEPGRREVDLLQLNIRTIRFDNVTVARLGVSDRAEEVDFMISADGAMNSLKKSRHPNQEIVSVGKITTTTLTAILNGIEPRVPRLIKIDTEGAERQILLPALQMLSRARSLKILFESQDVNNHAYGYTARQFLQELREAGFEIAEIGSNGVIVHFDKEDERVGRTLYNFVAWPK